MKGMRRATKAVMIPALVALMFALAAPGWAQSRRPGSRVGMVTSPGISMEWPRYPPIHSATTRQIVAPSATARNLPTGVARECLWSGWCSCIV